MPASENAVTVESELVKWLRRHSQSDHSEIEARRRSCYPQIAANSGGEDSVIERFAHFQRQCLG